MKPRPPFPPQDYDNNRGPLKACTWYVDEESRLLIRHLADHYSVTHSSLVRLLLAHALDAVAGGELTVDREPVLWKAILR